MVAAASAAPPASQPPAQVGRTSELTPATADRLLTLIRQGHKRKSACGMARVNYHTFNSWLTRAKADPTSIFAQFALQLEDAEAERNGMFVQRWVAATETDWRATAKYLAIVDPEEYSEQRRLSVDVSGTVQHTHVHTLALPDPDQWTQLAGLLGAPVIDGDAQEVAPPDLGDM